MLRILACLTVILIFCPAVHAEDAIRQEAASDSYVSEAQQLISFIASSGYTFIRNGKSYPPDRAADHIRMKYEHLRDHITSTEEFIDKCASRSSLTHIPYLAVDSTGHSFKVADLLYEHLTYLRSHTIVSNR